MMRGGCARARGGSLPADDCIDVFTKPMVNMVTPRSEVASPLDAARAARSHLRSPLSLGAELASQRLACSRLRRRWARLPLPHHCHALRRRAWLACAPRFSPFSAHFWLRFAAPAPTIASTLRLWFCSV